MSQENVEIVRRLIDQWNQRDAVLSLGLLAEDIEWMPAGPAAVEGAVYRGHVEVRRALEGVWQTWDEFRFEESEAHDLGDAVLWLGRVKMRGVASGIELDQEFAVRLLLQDRKVTLIQAFLAWREARKVVGLTE